jgi:hypothetical protein
MMKSIYRKWRTIFSLVLLGLLLITAVASAQEGGGFTDTFDDATMPGWEHSQNVQVTGGVLRIDPDNAAFHIGAYANPDITVRFKMSLPGGIVLHYHATESGVYRVQVLGEGGNAEIFLEKETNGVPANLGGSPVDNFIDGDWNTLTVTFQNGQHQVSLNSKQFITADDQEALPGGGIGLFVHGANPVEFDDLKVSASEVASPAPVGEQPQPVDQPVGEQAAPIAQQATLPPASVQTTPLVTPQPATGVQGLLEQLFVTGVNPVDVPVFTINLALAALLAFILGRVYIYWGASLSNRRKFAANFMLMAVTTTFIIQVVRSSVALSLGLVGALSIVRFRAAIKEPEELAYLFLAIGLGIGLGDNQRWVTILAFTIALIVLGLMKLLRHSQADVNMHLNITTNGTNKPDPEQVMNVLRQYCSKVKLLRFDENDHVMEMSFLVEFNRVSDLNQVRGALQAPVPGANISFLDNKGIW